ncbi:MAG: HEPN domain-containing protein, partial [Armatimonadia bacterium]
MSGSESEARRLLAQGSVRRADVDLGFARHGLSDPAFYLQGIGFHCQQAAEKMLKAFLILHDAAFPKTHDLLVLKNLCAALDPEFTTLTDACERLTPLAVETRYSDLGPLASPDEADEVIALAQQVYDFVKQRLD